MAASDNCIFRKGRFIILRVGHEYIVVNQDKVFKKGHTHVRSFDQAEYLVNMSIHKRVPNHLSPYMLTSLVRLTNDDEYADKIAALLAAKKERKQKYVNAS